VVAGERRTTIELSYRLPRGAAQGRDGWYLIRFHFVITFRSAPEHSLVYVGALANTWGASQVEFRTHRSGGAIA
jgi:hypothetical protein